jgi:hypothetical protein
MSWRFISSNSRIRSSPRSRRRRLRSLQCACDLRLKKEFRPRPTNKWGMKSKRQPFIRDGGAQSPAVETPRRTGRTEVFFADGGCYAIVPQEDGRSAIVECADAEGVREWIRGLYRDFAREGARP